MESRCEASEGIVLDYDASGTLVGIEIDNASCNVDLAHLVLTGMPGEIERRASEHSVAAAGVITTEAPLLAPLAGRIYDHAPQLNAIPLGGR